MGERLGVVAGRAAATEATSSRQEKQLEREMGSLPAAAMLKKQRMEVWGGCLH